MNIYYSVSTNMFYDGDLKESYETGSGWPDDCIKVTDDIFHKYINPAPEGKIRVAGSDGLPTWGDIPALTHEQLVNAAIAEKQSRIGQANDYISNKQWPGKVVLGRLKGEELTQYNLWLDYLDEIEIVDTSVPDNIVWPNQPTI